MSIDWAEITGKLPSDRADKDKRKELFSQFDPNGNGFLSLAEVEKGIRDVLQIDELFDAKPAIIRAFQIAKDVTKSKSSVGDDYIEFREFRFFLQSLRQYFEYYAAFSRTDSDNDKRISLDEFQENIDKVERWVGKIDDPEAEFNQIDTNGGGVILFEEFCSWAISKSLDIEDDDD